MCDFLVSMSKKRPKRVHKGEWLVRALEVLALEGVEGIRIDRLARDLDIAKSSFYWHFKNRADLLEKVLDHWACEYTEIVAQNQAMLQLDPETRLTRIASMIREYKLTKYDLSVRAWAEHDATAAQKVSGVFQQRMDFIREAFRELGFRGEELEMRTRVFVCYHTWEGAMFEGDSELKLTRLQKLRLKMLTMK